MAKYLNEQHDEYQIFYNNLNFKYSNSSKSYKMNIFRTQSFFVYIHFVRFGTVKRREHKVILKYLRKLLWQLNPRPRGGVGEWELFSAL